MPVQNCTDHAVTFQDYIGLPSTDNPLIGEKVENLEFSKFNWKEKLYPSDRVIFIKG